MYSQTLTRQRKQNINTCVRDIYFRIRGTAASSTKTTYTHQFHSNIDRTMIPDIITELQRLYPDIKMEYVQLKTLNAQTGNMEVSGHVIVSDWS
jgi:hypothetical protein